MIIGTVRAEETSVHDTHEGYHPFHMEETQEPHGSFEIFHQTRGWYWAAGFPGCLHDGEPSGPFATSRQALEDADGWDPEFDD